MLDLPCFPIKVTCTVVFDNSMGLEIRTEKVLNFDYVI